MMNPLSGIFRRSGYVAALDRAMETSAPKLTARLRASAVESGEWDERIAAQLRVRKAGKAFVVSVPDEVATAALDNEYGTTEKSPAAVVRKFANGTEWHADLIADALKEAGL